MTDRILVPLDGSSLAEQALSCAVALARGLASELILLRAIWMPPDVQETLAQQDRKLEVALGRLEEEAQDYLRSIAEQLRADGFVAVPVVQRGPAAEVILDYVGEAEAERIVMATHGYGGIKRWTHGSVAERVLQKAQVPLLLVRVREQDLDRDWRQPLACEHILVPLDGSSMAEQILPPVSAVARALEAELTLFQVPISYVSGWMGGEWYVPLEGMFDTAQESSTAYLDAVAGRLSEEGLEARKATAIGAVADCIIEYAQANEMDLVAMCTHGRTGLARWALGSVADRVLRAGTTPILLVRAR